MSRTLPKSKFAKQTTFSSRASRLNLYISRQSNHFLGNVSLIKVNIKIINQIVDVIPLEEDTFQTLKERALASVKKDFAFHIDEKTEDHFTFFWGKSSLKKEEEALELEQVLQNHYESMDPYFEGDILSISLLLKNAQIEYQFLQENLQRLKTPSVNALFLVKQFSKDKKILKNRVLKIEDNTDCWLVTIYNAKGDLKDAYNIYSLITDKIERMKIENNFYFPLVFKLTESEDLEELTVENFNVQIFFSLEADLDDFIQNLEKIRQARLGNMETFNEELILESIEELGRKETENLDEAVEVGRIDSFEYKMFQKSCLPNDFYYSTFSPINTRKDQHYFVEQKELTNNDTVNPIFTTEAAVKYKHNESVHYETSYYFDPEKPSTTSKLKYVSSKSLAGINHTILQKKELDLNNQEFEVKMKGLFGIKYNRILRFSDDFELLFFKKEKEKYIFTQSILISNIVKILPKNPYSHSAYFSLKSDKKQQKPIKIGFKDNDDLGRFFRLSRRIADLFKSSANSFQTEKDKGNNQKLYPWLISPVDLSVTQHHDPGIKNIHSPRTTTCIQFKIINLSESQDPEIAHIDLMSSILTFKSSQKTVKRKLNMRDILSCEINFKDPRGLTLILKNKKYKLLFSDNKNRLFFETAIYNTILPKYKIPSKQRYEWQPIKVFCTTFNVGFGKPPVALGMWLNKAKDSEIIAIGMQETDTADWIQAIYQDELIKSNFTIVTVVTMWKMLILVAVKTKYANYITNVEVHSKATGIAKLIGNKGGVAVSFRFMESGFCFLSCHLAAGPGQDRMQTRKSDFYNLMKSIRMGDENLDMCSMYDYFFFMGDTNFRLDYDFFKAVDTIEQNEYLTLLPHDQYKKARDDEGFMNIFKEGQITFKPTYRRMRDNEGYSNKKNQAPSWTDRIFVKSRTGHLLSFQEYDSVEMFFLSDHRPVYCICDCEVQPPYLSRIPIYSRPAEQFGIIKFSNINLNYDFTMASKMEEFIGSLTLPLSATIGFRAKFLLKAATTLPLDVDESNSQDIVWTQELMPLLYCIIPDYRFLRSENLLILIKASNQENSSNEIIIGQAEISLEDLILNKGTKTSFKSDVFIYGKQFGKLTGQVMYSLTH